MKEFEQTEMVEAKSADTTPGAIKPKKGKHRKWLIVLGLFVLIFSLAIPKVSLLFGLALLLICVGVFIPKTKALSYKFLKIDPEKRWKTIFRFTMFVLIGFGYIGFTGFSASLMEERERLTAEQAAKEAMQQKLENEANEKVSDLAKQAEDLWLKGDLRGAEAIISSAKKTQHVSDLAPMTRVEVKIANAKVEAIMAEATSAAEDGRLEVAEEKVAEARAIRHATNLDSAIQLQKDLELVANPKNIEKILLDIGKEDFEALTNGTMPQSLITGRQGIDRKTEEHVQDLLPKVADTRKNIEQEKIRKQRIRSAAEYFVENYVGKKIPYERLDILGRPETLKGTNNKYWVAYLSEGDVSFVSEKASDIIIYAAFGKNKAPEYLAAMEAKREEKVQGQFSSWDGSHRGLTMLIKKSMNDPGSYDHEETVYWDMGDHLVVRTTFRGKNAFGGTVINWVKAKVDFDGNVIEVMEQGP